jgi:osmotically-inducible protein OsmY
MQERETGRRGPSEPRGPQRAQDDYRDYESGSKSMTSRPANSPQQGTDEWAGEESGGGWSGYVVPYRYYGPGYRGVGYYTVMYQGGDDDPGEGETRYEQRGSGFGQGSSWDTRTGSNARSQSRRGFTGRGPKGYQRSDERLREEVSDRLMADDQIDASDIEVTVANGEVALTGTVDDRRAKRRAEDCAEQVMGVRDVMNHIRVQRRSFEGEGANQSTSSATSGSGPQRGSSQAADGDRDRSADGRTGSNGRRKTTSSR